MPSFIRKAARMVFGILATLLAGFVIGLIALLIASPGKPASIVDERGQPIAGSISEKIRVPINGVEQGMFIQGANASNPVLLFLHGGAGMPQYFLNRRYPTGLEEIFTVVWWDRRGAGLSYRADIAPETMTVEQMIADTLAVTNYLRQRFGQDKIYLMGHSGGAFFGILAAARAPELYHAYIGVGQMTYQLQSEQQSYAYMLEQFKQRGDTRMVRAFEQAPVTMTVPLPDSYMAVRDEAMHTLGVGTTRDMNSVITGVFLASWGCPAYTVGEKLAIWRGKAFCQQMLWDTMLATDVTQQVTALDLPVYFFHGAYDYTVSYSQAQAYAARLQAPVKGFYTFEQSAHSPIYEEPERARQIIREDVLRRKNGLADAR